MIPLAFNLFFYTLLFLLIGLFKPNWALFFMSSPSRLMVIIISVILFMITATLFGEGNQQHQAEQKTAVKQRVIDDVPNIEK